MRPFRLGSILTLAILVAALSPEQGYDLLSAVLSGKPAERAAASRKLAAARDLSLVPAMVDTLFFASKADREPLVEALRKLTGEDAGPRYYDWVELVGRRTDLKPAPGYVAWKGSLFSRIDPRYREIFDPGATIRLRPEEIVWGGVPLDGIPSLDDPPRVAAAKARSLMDQERVFAVSLGGEHRAYPLRYLSWHEMLNDTVGGQPLTLSFCTLCGTGIAYSSRLPDGTHTFGTSGLLYRSNKLMFDRETLTLWSNLTGEAVLGKMADRPFRLEMLPMTLTSWGEWKSLHPDTTVVELDAAYGAKWGYRYLPGSADQRRAGVSFPVWAKSRLLPERAEVYGLRQGDRAKAWPIERVLREGVVNDRLGDLELVLVGNPESGAVRAYRRNGRTFRSGSAFGELSDEADRVWRITEEALVSEGTAPLPRVPGHVALWFAWFGFFPQTEVYGGA